MSQAQAALSQEVENAAIKAIYQLQYNTATAANFVKSEVPATTYEMAIEAINKVVRPSKKIRVK